MKRGIELPMCVAACASQINVYSQDKAGGASPVIQVSKSSSIKTFQRKSLSALHLRLTRPAIRANLDEVSRGVRAGSSQPIRVTGEP